MTSNDKLVILILVIAAAIIASILPLGFTLFFLALALCGAALYGIAHLGDLWLVKTGEHQKDEPKKSVLVSKR